MLKKGSEGRCSDMSGLCACVCVEEGRECCFDDVSGLCVCVCVLKKGENVVLMM